MIDSHCHLDHEPLLSDLSNVIKRSKEVGIKNNHTNGKVVTKDYSIMQLLADLENEHEDEDE